MDDAWGFIALAALLGLAGKRQTTSSLVAIAAFALAAVAVWALTTRRIQSTEIQRSHGTSDMAAADAPRDAHDMTDGTLKGPYGWLLVYRIGLLVVAPFQVVSLLSISLTNAADFSAGDWLRQLPANVLAAGPVLYGVFVGALLTYEHSAAIRHVKQHVLVTLICVSGLVARLLFLEGVRYATRFGVYLLLLTAGGYIWIRYFRQSRRVLRTFGDDAVRRAVSGRTLLLATAMMVVVLALPLTVLRAFWPAVDGAWTAYVPSTSFQIGMPGPAEITRESFQEPDGSTSIVITAVVETFEGRVFSVSHIDLAYDVDAADRMPILDDMVGGAVGAAEITENRAIEVQEYPAREFVAVDYHARLVFRGRVALIGRTAVTLLAIGSGDRTDAAAADRFFKSLVLTNP